MDINSYSYAPHMLDAPAGALQDIAICAECENLFEGECEYKKENCCFVEMAD